MRHRTKASDKKNGAHLERPAPRTFDLNTISPDELRDRVRAALLNLSPGERIAVRDQLLAQLHRAGLNIGNCLFSLGIMAETPADLTPSDLAYLIRYIRINSPRKIRAVVRLLDLLLFPDDKKKELFRLAA
jgi:hypothetical protein